MTKPGYPNLDDYVPYADYYAAHVKESSVSGDQMTGLCCFHDDKKKSLSIELKTGKWKCHAGCGKGNATDFEAKRLGVDRGQAYKSLCLAYNVPRTDKGNGARPAAKPAPAEKKVADNLFIPEDVWEKFQVPSGEWYEGMQRIRGWSREACEKFSLRIASYYCSKTGKVRASKTPDRISIPIRDKDGILRNIRSYHPRPPEGVSKIMSWASGYGIARNLPFMPFADGTVYLVEGEPDCICAISNGINAITHTSKPNKYSAELLEPYKGRDVVICYDADKPGQAYAMLSAINIAKVAKSLKFLEWPDYMGKLPGGDWPDKHGEDLTDFFVKHKRTIEEFYALPTREYKEDEVKAAIKANETLSPKALEAFSNFNRNWFVAPVGSKCCVVHETIDPTTGRPTINFYSVNDFHNLHANIEAYRGEKPCRASKLWFEQPNRRQYSRVIVFEPSGNVPEGSYNLWRGLAVQPQAGDWSRFREFIFEVIAGGVDSIFKYLIAWMARIVQEPGGQRPGVAVVLRGGRGVGKSTFAEVFGRIFGNHYLQISSSRHLTDKFNSHLKDVVLLHADEALWTGEQRQSEGRLKALITEPTISIEPKGRDVITVRNNLNIIFSSNSDRVVPAGEGERRFLVLDVPTKRQQDHAYFETIRREMKDGGGLRAMLFDLQKLDISGINLRNVPRTEALFDQVMRTMDSLKKFWLERLLDGALLRNAEDWPREIESNLFYSEYSEFCAQQRDLYPLSRELFFAGLSRACPGIIKTRKMTSGVRVYMRVLPPLGECREQFQKFMRADINWQNYQEDKSDRIPI
jgi:hypothetical protein